MFKLFIGIVLLGVGMLVWMFGVEPRLLVTRFYKFSAPELKNLKIVFISDLHIAPQHEKRLQKIVREVNALRPDIILLGGDFVKGHKFASTMVPEKIADELKNLQAPFGVFAVLGNHDWYFDGNRVRQALQKNNIRVLENENLYIATPKGNFTLAGVADYTMRIPDIEKSLKNAKAPVLLLSHSPDVFPQVQKNVFLTLAGHTHGGQFALPFLGPIIVPSDYKRRFAGGLIDEDGQKMVVNRGLGTSLLPLRFNCPPEIVVIEF